MGFINKIFKTNASMLDIRADDPTDQLVQEAEGPVQGFLNEDEIKALIDFVAKKEASINECDFFSRDPIIREVAMFIVQNQQASTSLIQRKFSIGYNRAGRIVDQLEQIGIIGHAEHLNQREILINNTFQIDLTLQKFDPDSEIMRAFIKDYSQQIEERKKHFINLMVERGKREYAEYERQQLEQEKELIKQKVKERILRQKARELAMLELADEGIIELRDKREPINQDVQDRVWNRDGGKCIKCGSQENLEFDHIIPYSRGGSNSVRNLQLLCQKCNREKSNNIGHNL